MLLRAVVLLAVPPDAALRVPVDARLFAPQLKGNDGERCSQLVGGACNQHSMRLYEVGYSVQKSVDGDCEYRCFAWHSRNIETLAAIER